MPLTVRETERAALCELEAVLRLVESGKLSVSDKTRRPSAAATRLYRGSGRPTDGRPVPAATVVLDAEQRRAVEAHDGVVQVIAPAGSGKTAVMIERVRELLRRGTPAERILCTTFNRDARLELQERLRAATLESMGARTFHSIGWWLMREERLTRARGVRGQLSLGQWKRLCALAGREEGGWIEPADARAAISGVKLALLATPREFRRQADEHADGPTLARIYELYEQHLADQQVNDFDDLVLVAVRALREDAELRRRWQSRFRHVLVDEYQDIEPGRRAGRGRRRQHKARRPPQRELALRPCPDAPRSCLSLDRATPRLAGSFQMRKLPFSPKFRLSWRQRSCRVARGCLDKASQRRGRMSPKQERDLRGHEWLPVWMTPGDRATVEARHCCRSTDVLQVVSADQRLEREATRLLSPLRHVE